MNIKQSVKLPKGIYRGVLAENYDGRQKKVLVSASIGSTSSALVSALFEKTSTLEAGAPVLLKQINGQVYIVSGGGRLGRLCEDFDRAVDAVAITTSTIDEDGTDVFGESPHEGEWSWQGVTATNPAPGDDIAGIDASGAYVIAGGSNRDIYVETPENAIVVDYAFDLYVRIKSKSLGNEKLTIVFDSTEDDPTAYVKVSLHFDTTGGYKILTKLTDSTLLPFTFVAGTWYWVRIGYYPGDSIGVAIWEDTGDENDEPDTYLYELNEEDGAYIPEEINKFQLGWLNIDAADRITVSSMKIFGHCTDWTLLDPKLGDPCAEATTQLTFCCGFEEQGYTDGAGGLHGSHNWTDSGGGDFLSWRTDIQRSGAACIQFSGYGGTPGTGRVRTPQSTQIHIGSGWIRYEGMHSAGCSLIAWSPGGVIGINNSSGQIYADAGGGTQVNGPTLTANEWHRIDWFMDTRANPHVLKWYVDGVEQTDATWATAGVTITFFDWRVISTAGTVVQMDDFVFSQTIADYPLGGYHIERGMAIADGTHSQGSGDFEDQNNVNIVPGSAYLLINTLSTTDNIHQRTGDGAGYLEFMLTEQTTQDRPDAVYLGEIGRQDGVIGAGNRQCRIFIDGADHIWASGAADGNQYAFEGQEFLGLKPNGNRWNLADLNAMRLRYGYSTDTSPFQRIASFLYEAAFKDDSACDDIP